MIIQRSALALAIAAACTVGIAIAPPATANAAKPGVNACVTTADSRDVGAPVSGTTPDPPAHPYGPGSVNPGRY